MISDNECRRLDASLPPSGALASPKLQQAHAIRTLQKALEGELGRLVLYGALRGETLVWHFSHPAALMSWRMQKERVLERMRAIYKEEKLGSVLRFRRVDATVVPVSLEREAEPERPQERATGNFAIAEGLDPRIRQSFERIARHIRHYQEEGERS